MKAKKRRAYFEDVRLGDTLISRPVRLSRRMREGHIKLYKEDWDEDEAAAARQVGVMPAPSIITTEMTGIIFSPTLKTMPKPALIIITTANIDAIATPYLYAAAMYSPKKGIYKNLPPFSSVAFMSEKLSPGSVILVCGFCSIKSTSLIKGIPVSTVTDPTVSPVGKVVPAP